MKFVHRKLLVIIFPAILVLCACGKEGSNVAHTVNDPSQMPDIVFMNICDYTEISEEGDEQYAITFYDKNGNHYVSDDSYGSYICSLKYEELISEYAAGNLDDKITFHTTCDVNELFENYRKLCEVSKNEDYEILYPEAVPAVESIKIKWYGLYYDKKGELHTLQIHEKRYGEDFESNDERANEIYNWYIGTFQKQTDPNLSMMN